MSISFPGLPDRWEEVGGDVVLVDLLEVVLWDFGVRGVAARPDVWHATVAANGV